MTVPLLQVDAFSDKPFAGNPAGVCLLDEPRSEAWMQAVAAEMNLAETAFPVRRNATCYDLRWFTPTTEIDLCGHATLATAHVLWDRGIVPRGEPIEFRTKSGSLGARPADDGWIELDFPAWRFAEPHGPSGPAERAAIEKALGVHAAGALRRDRDWLLEVRSAAEVAAVAPDMKALAVAGDMVIVTAPAAGIGVDFVLRVFVPAFGIPEDPVTGSAHCILGPFWAERLGRDFVTGFQASKRGGTVKVTVRGERVGIAGRAVTVFEARLTEAADKRWSSAER